MGWLSRPYKVHIRKSQASDAAAFSGLHAQGFERAWGISEFESLLCEKAVCAHMAQTSLNHPCGFIISRVAADEAEILSVAVAKNARQKGVGGQLLNLHLSALAQSGAKAVFLEVDELNLAAIALYKHFGFAIVGTRKAYYKRTDGSSPSALVMKRCLK